ncbi:MAG: hypothetical protein IGS54_05220 [Elainella sp. C42_A2020_010]|nr:hypothetical protein [Elainella sp. C42_A2020_010]RNJ68551.1 MAG: hypothetical protein EDM05_15790 [Leptolyngbya sp. IPPAS B-1204]
MVSNRVFSVCLAALPILLVVSCTNQTPQATTQDKKTELCTNLARLNTSVATLKSLSPSSTVSDLQAARDQVKTTFADVKTSAQAVQEAKVADLEQAYQELDKAVNAIPQTATLNQAAQSIAPQVAAVENARNQVEAGVNCP